MTTDTPPGSNDDSAVDIRLLIDRDLERAGFDVSTIVTEGIDVGFSERLGADPWFMVVLAGVGWKTLDAITRQAASRAVDRLIAFAKSREKQLKVECEARNVDPRVELVMASITTASQDEFSRALRLIPSISSQIQSILGSTSDSIRDIYFVWQDGLWGFSYYINDSGDIIEEL
jgi:hypothetical protein